MLTRRRIPRALTGPLVLLSLCLTCCATIYEHNSYTAAAGITFQFNRYGPLRADCLGNNLKDRSAGTVIRYNWIEGGNRQLDLVDAEDVRLVQVQITIGVTIAPGSALAAGDVFHHRAAGELGDRCPHPICR